MSAFDTVAELTRACQSYESLHEALDSRHEAYYTRKERLNEFVVLGRMRLDTCGNAMPLVEPSDSSWSKGLPLVLPIDQAYDAILRAGLEGRIGSISSAIPDPNLLCPCCGKGWDLTNFTDYVSFQNSENIPLDEYVGRVLGEVFKTVITPRTEARYFMCDYPIRNDVHIDLTQHPEYATMKVNERGYLQRRHKRHDGEYHGVVDPDAYVIKQGDEGSFQAVIYKHKQCRAAELFRETKAEFTKAFEDAGVKVEQILPIRNEYGSISYNGPWYKITTKIGVFTVGWRKRVIELDWTDLKADLLHLFQDVDDTKDSHSIHAWNYEMLAEYIRRIANRKETV